MTDQPGWYENLTHRVDFLGHTEPHPNRALISHLRAGSSILTFPRAAPRDMASAIDRALGLTPQMEKAAE